MPIGIIDQFEKEVISGVLSKLNEYERKALCVGAQTRITYRIELSETIGEADVFEFDYGHGVKKEHFALSCSQKSNIFLRLEVLPNDGARMKIVLIKSELLSEELIEPESD